MVVIPRKIIKKVFARGGLLPEKHHYEYLSTTKYLVIYRCIENGTLECFQKKDFLEEKGVEKKIYPFKNMNIEAV